MCRSRTHAWSKHGYRRLGPEPDHDLWGQFRLNSNHNKKNVSRNMKKIYVKCRPQNVGHFVPTSACTASIDGELV